MQGNDTRSIQEQDDASDHAIMGFLLDDPGPWCEVELTREFSNPLSVEDGLNRLACEGMIHRLDGFVFASRTAKQAHAIYQG
jgi:hypothetical protein